MKKELERFINAQHTNYHQALAEIKKGKKQSHWMWYIFPQIQGLGFSETAKFYAIADLQEAAAYLQHQILGSRLLAISNELLKLRNSDAHQIFGSPDDLKLKSSLTLFSCLPNADPVFQLLLDKFFNGAKDSRTLEILKK
ncbi:DUF1810 domain-containing protein [Pedobacter sp. L105]|uniref:DUF1810 domain-containing protein n=1 Tax=Pedobacter sp. L105 TaxID=1641871 RepID=UPI00131E42DC|nr:DUF1810 domain-containing protein [Pedobacter sp. L105]